MEIVSPDKPTVASAAPHSPLLETQSSLPDDEEEPKTTFFRRLNSEDIRKMRTAVKQYPRRTKRALSRYRSARNQLSERSKHSICHSEIIHLSEISLLKHELESLKERFFDQEQQKLKAERENEVLKYLVNETVRIEDQGIPSKACCSLF